VISDSVGYSASVGFSLTLDLCHYLSLLDDQSVLQTSSSFKVSSLSSTLVLQRSDEFLCCYDNVLFKVDKLSNEDLFVLNF
jgi:hypothetical protein